MNFLDGTLAAPDRIDLGSILLACERQGGPRDRARRCEICIRPEDVRVRDLRTDAANRVTVEVAEVDFIGAFCRATLRAGTLTLTADFSSNLMRDLGVAQGRWLNVALPPDRLRIFAA